MSGCLYLRLHKVQFSSSHHQDTGRTVLGVLLLQSIFLHTILASMILEITVRNGWGDGEIEIVNPMCGWLYTVTLKHIHRHKLFLIVTNIEGTSVDHIRLPKGRFKSKHVGMHLWIFRISVCVFLPFARLIYHNAFRLQIAINTRSDINIVLHISWKALLLGKSKMSVYF